MSGLPGRFKRRVRRTSLNSKSCAICMPAPRWLMAWLGANKMPYRRPDPACQPSDLYEAYRSTLRRAPSKPLIVLPHTLTEESGPVFGHDAAGANDDDLTRQHGGEPLGERIIVAGKVMDDGGRPVPHTLVEIWQTNAAGRYAHVK